MNIIQLKDLEVSYEGEVVLKQINLNISDNDFIAIIGPNGGGKTTLIKAILGLVPYRGEISFDLSLQGEKGVLRIGYMPQVSHFDRAFPITIEEVVMSGIARCASYSKEQLEKGRELMKRAGILPIAQRRIGKLSGGELQRALLCRAIICNPRLLILDEPTNFVDRHFEESFYQLLEELNHQMAIIVISHDIDNICSRAKRCIHINQTICPRK